ncbi:hypothetical protein ABZP36_022894 [Zizania latifolia]
MDGFQLKHPGDVMLECDLQTYSGGGEERSKLSVVEKEVQMLSSIGTAADAYAFTSPEHVHSVTYKAKLDASIEKKTKNISDKQHQFFPESGADDAFDFGDMEPLSTDVQTSTTLKAEGEDLETSVDLALTNFHRDYEVFFDQSLDENRLLKFVNLQTSQEEINNLQNSLEVLSEEHSRLLGQNKKLEAEIANLKEKLDSNGQQIEEEIEKIDFHSSTLHPILLECCVIKVDMEIALTQEWHGRASEIACV